MDKIVINGGKPLKGTIKVLGAKNVAMKVILAALLCDEKVTVRGVPNISSVTGTADIIRPLGVKVDLKDHVLTVNAGGINKYDVPLDVGGLYRSATMVMGPLLARFGKAKVPNPGGCRIGLRPIDRHIEGLKSLGAQIEYNPEDGYFYAKASKLIGSHYHFKKNSHTGTETLLLAAVKAHGETVIDNASAEPEVDDLIKFLNAMGAKIRRTEPRKITVQGVRKLHGVDYTIMTDRNEIVTYAIAAIATKGDITIEGADQKNIQPFLDMLTKAGAKWEIKSENSIRFYSDGKLYPTHVVTAPHPGFMTDWQAPWTLLMTQAAGESTVHETVFENRFSYVDQLKKMGANIFFYEPLVTDPDTFYNFNFADKDKKKYQAIRIVGPTKLHNAILETMDLRAGATVIIAGLVAEGESTIHDLGHIDRGYEEIDERLSALGADIKRINA